MDTKTINTINKASILFAGLSIFLAIVAAGVSVESPTQQVSTSGKKQGR